MKNLISDLFLYSSYYFIFGFVFFLLIAIIVSIMIIKKYSWKYFIQRFNEAIEEQKDFFNEPPINMKEQRKKWKKK